MRLYSLDQRLTSDIGVVASKPRLGLVDATEASKSVVALLVTGILWSMAADGPVVAIAARPQRKN